MSTASCRVVGPHLTAPEREQPAIGDGDAMGVAAEIGQHLLGPSERWLGVDYPVEALGRLPPRLLPAGARPLAAVPPTVLAEAEERLRGRQAAVLHQSRQSCRTAGLRTSPARTPAPRLGSLRQATVRRARAGAGLSQPLHPSRRHRQ